MVNLAVVVLPLNKGP